MSRIIGLLVPNQPWNAWPPSECIVCMFQMAFLQRYCISSGKKSLSQQIVQCHCTRSMPLISESSYPSRWMTETTRKRSQLITFRQGMRKVMSHEPYIKLVIGFLFTSLAFMVTSPCSICLINVMQRVKAFAKVGNCFFADSMDSCFDSQQLVLPGACYQVVPWVQSTNSTQMWHTKSI